MPKHPTKNNEQLRLELSQEDSLLNEATTAMREYKRYEEEMLSTTRENRILAFNRDKYISRIRTL